MLVYQLSAVGPNRPLSSASNAAQANVTDNVPLHVLGGIVLPLSRGGMTTAAVRASPLTLLIALGQPYAPHVPRCGACSMCDQLFIEMI